MKLLVIVPAFNEAKSIVRVVENLKRVCPEYDYVVVNDGSTDDTAEICREHGYPLLNLPLNLGLSDAFGAGMKYAFRNHYDAAIQFDADGQHRPEYIPALADKLGEGYDIVIGSRFVSEARPFSMRMLGNFLISFLIRLTVGTELKDPTSGMRMYNGRIIREFARQLNMTPEPDTISYLLQRGVRLAEVQVSMEKRQEGQSYLNLSRSARYMFRIVYSILLVQRFRKGSRFHTPIVAQMGGKSILAKNTAH